MKNFLLIFAVFIISPSWADVLNVKNVDVTYSIRESKYNQDFDKLNVDIEIQLVKKRLPTELEIRKVSEKVLSTLPKAKMTWVGYYLPKMPSNAGYFATDHRTPEPEGVKVLTYMLYNTPYEGFMK
jgi:hypothetical protein